MKFFTVFLMIFLVGCAATPQSITEPSEPVIAETPMKDKLKNHPSIKNNQPITVAVYNFTDKTGQRKPADNIANISTAVTQGAEIYLIKALMDVSNGNFFRV